MDTQIECLVDKVKSSNRDLVLHAITTIENLELDDPRIIEQLKLHLEDRDEEIQAKALLALTGVIAKHDYPMEDAARMLASKTSFVVYAAIISLATIPEVDDKIIRIADRAFGRALQSCDYGLVELFARAYLTWLPEPVTHIADTFEDGYEEYIDTALEAIKNVKLQRAAESKETSAS